MLHTSHGFTSIGTHEPSQQKCPPQQSKSSVHTASTTLGSMQLQTESEPNVRQSPSLQHCALNSQATPSPSRHGWHINSSSQKPSSSLQLVNGSVHSGVAVVVVVGSAVIVVVVVGAAVVVVVVGAAVVVVVGAAVVVVVVGAAVVVVVVGATVVVVGSGPHAL
jgi:nitrate reductase gamma subunit